MKSLEKLKKSCQGGSGGSGRIGEDWGGSGQIGEDRGESVRIGENRGGSVRNCLTHDNNINIKQNTTICKQNIKNIIIDHIVYKIEGAAGTRPRLYLEGKHVGYIREGVVEWVGP